MIGVAGQASVGEIGETQNILENNLNKKVETKVVANSFPSIHGVSSDTAVYLTGLVAGQPIDMLVDTGSAVTLVHQRIGSKIVNLQSKSGDNKVFRISLAETVVVPGRHEIVLHAKVKGDGCGDGLLGLVNHLQVLPNNTIFCLLVW